jgi:hypothetical protein
MNTINRPKRSNPPLPVSIVKTATAVDYSSAGMRARVIDRATRRIEQQQQSGPKENSKIKGQTKTATPGISPKLPSPVPKVPVSNPSTISTPLVPVFSEQTKAKFDLAVRALKGTRSLSERLTIAACHLRGDPVLAAIDPRELWKELSSQSNFKS